MDENVLQNALFTYRGNNNSSPAVGEIKYKRIVFKNRMVISSRCTGYKTSSLVRTLKWKLPLRLCNNSLIRCKKLFSVALLHSQKYSFYISWLVAHSDWLFGIPSSYKFFHRTLSGSWYSICHQNSLFIWLVISM